MRRYQGTRPSGRQIFHSKALLHDLNFLCFWDATFTDPCKPPFERFLAQAVCVRRSHRGSSCAPSEECDRTLVDTSGAALACAFTLCRYPSSRMERFADKGMSAIEGSAAPQVRNGTLTGIVSAGGQAVADVQARRFAACAYRWASGRGEGSRARFAPSRGFRNHHQRYQGLPSLRLMRRQITGDKS